MMRLTSSILVVAVGFLTGVAISGGCGSTPADQPCSPSIDDAVDMPIASGEYTIVSVNNRTGAAHPWDESEEKTVVVNAEERTVTVTFTNSSGGVVEERWAYGEPEVWTQFP